MGIAARGLERGATRRTQTAGASGGTTAEPIDRQRKLQQLKLNLTVLVSGQAGTTDSALPKDLFSAIVEWQRRFEEWID